MSEEQIPVKRPRGRPRKDPLIQRDVRREEPTKKFKMRASPNWENFDPAAEDTPDRLKINPDLIPDGMAAMWVTDSVLGQAVPQHRSQFERKGWTPVHQDDFDGQFNGMFMPKNAPGEINVEGVVLMVRPKELQEQARRNERRKAREQVAIKEQALRSGDIPIGLDPRHETAIRSNKIVKSMERIQIPSDE